MRYYIIAGEKSGDQYGGQLMQAIRQEDPQAEFRCWGGACMQKAGGIVVVSYQDLALMGIDFLGSLFRLSKYINYCKKDLLLFQPDALILIDYAGFNLRMAQFAKKYSITTFYYISPKIWAWHTNRVQQIKASVDCMFTIFPFETDFYKKYGYHVNYVGNPLLEQINSYKTNSSFKEMHHLDQRPIIALLPGSRNGEIKRILPTMLSIVTNFPTYQFVIAAVSEASKVLYAQAQKASNIHIVYDQMHDVLANAHTAIVTSGTATLETAFFQVPQIVVYKTHMLSYILAKILVRIKHISLVNIIANQKIVQELVQYQLTEQNLLYALKALVNTPQARQRQLAGYKKVQQLLGNKQASKTVAQSIIHHLISPTN